MNSNTYLFAASPPYFDFKGVEDKLKATKELNELIKEYTPRCIHLNACGFCIFQQCFALLCFVSISTFYGRRFIKNKLHSSLFFTRVPREVRDLAKVKFPWNATPDMPSFTGLLCCFCFYNFVLFLLLNYLISL